MKESEVTESSTSTAVTDNEITEVPSITFVAFRSSLLLVPK